MIEYEFPMLVSSDPLAGAQNISSNGDSFEITLDRPIVIPREAENCYITVKNATIVWNFPNIIQGVNDIFQVEYLGTPHTITVEQGLYDLDHLNSALSQVFVNLGIPSDLLMLVPDTATNKVVVQFNYASVQIDFTVANTFRDILGFNSRLVPLVLTTGVQFEKADNKAAFNTIEYILIHSDLISRGIKYNNTYNQTVARVLIDVDPGSQIQHEPFNLPHIPAIELPSEKRRNLRFWLTDNNNNPVDTGGEIWSATIVIHYTMKEEPRIIMQMP